MVVVVAFGALLATFVYFFVRVRWNKHALALMDTGQYEGAIRIFSRVIRFYPQDAVALYNRASIYKQQGNYDAALADHNQAIAKGGRMSAAMYAARAYFLIYLGRYDEALADYHMALQADPDQFQALLGIAYTYLFMKQYDKALEQTEGIVQKLEAQIAKNAEYGAYMVTQTPQADAQLENIYVSVYAVKALALVYLGRGDEAKVIYESLAQKYPNSLVLHIDRAEMHFLLSDFESSIVDYEVALQLTANMDNIPSTSTYNLAEVAMAGRAVALFAKGDTENAHVQWHDFMNKSPRLASSPHIGKEFSWSDAMTIHAQKLIASLNA